MRYEVGGMRCFHLRFKDLLRLINNVAKRNLNSFIIVNYCTPKACDMNNPELRYR